MALHVLDFTRDKGRSLRHWVTGIYAIAPPAIGTFIPLSSWGGVYYPLVPGNSIQFQIITMPYAPFGPNVVGQIQIEEFEWWVGVRPDDACPVDNTITGTYYNPGNEGVIPGANQPILLSVDCPPETDSPWTQGLAVFNYVQEEFSNVGYPCWQPMNTHSDACREYLTLQVDPLFHTFECGIGSQFTSRQYKGRFNTPIILGPKQTLTLGVDISPFTGIPGGTCGFSWSIVVYARALVSHVL